MKTTKWTRCVEKNGTGYLKLETAEGKVLVSLKMASKTERDTKVRVLHATVTYYPTGGKYVCLDRKGDPCSFGETLYSVEAAKRAAELFLAKLAFVS